MMIRAVQWICRIVSGYLGFGLIIVLYETAIFPTDIYDIPWGTGGCLGWNYETPEIYFVGSVFLCIYMATIFVASLPMAKRISLSRVSIFIATLAFFGIFGQSEVDRDFIHYFAGQIELDYPR